MNSLGTRLVAKGHLMCDTAVSVSSDDTGASFKELFHVRSMPKLAAKSTSIDVKVMGENKKQKERLQAAGYADFKRESTQRDEMNVGASTTKKMKDFWLKWESGNSSSGSTVYKVMQRVSDAQSHALSMVRKFWQSEAAKTRRIENSPSQRFEERSAGLYVGDVSLGVDVGMSSMDDMSIDDTLPNSKQ
jgi:hypothetical protein